MPTPRTGYFLKDGSRVPGTTTIIGRFKESGGLLQWAFSQGKQGKQTLYEEAEKAADIGTCVHSMVEAHVKDGSEDEDAIYEAFQGDKKKVLSGYAAYLQWERMMKPKIIAQEMQLVSEIYRYGGTPDAVGEIEGELVLLDWKTSNAVYTDHLIQLAAYRQLWNENNSDRPLTGGSHLCRFAKEHGDFAHHHFPNLDDAWEQFLLFRQAYEIDKSLKKRAA